MTIIRDDPLGVMSRASRAMVGVLALFAVSGCLADAPQPQSKLREYSIMVGGVERWTSVYQPPGYRSGQPVVLLLHGGTQNVTNATTGDAKGDKQNWNDLRPSDATGQTGADDVGFLMALLDWARDQYRYDPRRVYVPDPNTNNACHITRTTRTAQQPGAADVVFSRDY